MTLAAVAADFESHFGRPARVVARAPGRVNLIGEHTDYNDGFVLPMAIEQSTWVACASRSDGQVRARSSTLPESAESVWQLGQWRRDAQPHWTSYVAGVADLLVAHGARLLGADILIHSTVPLGGGLSSSAALEIASVKALAEMAGEPLETTELVDLARRAEHEYAGVPCGIMDQTASLLSRAGHAMLLDCRSREIDFVRLSLKQHSFVVIDSGVRHELAAGEYAKRLEQCRAAVDYFARIDPKVKALRDVPSGMVRSHASQMDPLVLSRALHVTTENERTQSAAQCLRSGDVAAFGKLLTESHRSLRDNYEVSCRELDQLVKIAAAVPGVAGARMTGAGFGGCIVALVRDDTVEPLRSAVQTQYTAPGDRPARIVITPPGAGASIEHA
jgi:galactokinase